MRTIDQLASRRYERCRQRRQKQCEEQLVRTDGSELPDPSDGHAKDYDEGDDTPHR